MTPITVDMDSIELEVSLPGTLVVLSEIPEYPGIELELVYEPAIQAVLPTMPEIVVEVLAGGLGARGEQGVQGIQGIQGIQGLPGDSLDLTSTMEAGENLSSGRVVIVSASLAYYFQNTDTSHAGRAYGVTITSALLGENVQIQIFGLVTDSSFTFAVDKLLWVGVDGEIVDTVPSGSVLQKAGISTGVDTLKLDFSQQLIIS